jgi:hypothetical protein
MTGDDARYSIKKETRRIRLLVCDGDWFRVETEWSYPWSALCIPLLVVLIPYLLMHALLKVIRPAFDLIIITVA